MAEIFVQQEILLKSPSNKYWSEADTSVCDWYIMLSLCWIGWNLLRYSKKQMSVFVVHKAMKCITPVYLKNYTFLALNSVSVRCEMTRFFFLVSLVV